MLWFVNKKIFGKELGLGKNRRILLALDQAGWHTSQKLKIPEGVNLIFLPPHSPELQPAEKLWSVVDEPIVNKAFENLDQLEEVLVKRCQVLLKNPDLIRGLTGFHWWLKMGA